MINDLNNNGTLNGIGVVPVAAVAAAASAAPKITDKLKETVDKIKSWVSFDDVSQDRFIDRTLEVDKIFENAGYDQAVNPGISPYKKGELLTKYRLRKTQVDNKKNNYQEEFDRLHAYIVERLNIYNPGLGDYWKRIQPSLPLDNQGNIKGAELASLKELVQMFPPLAYRGQTPFGLPGESMTTVTALQQVSQPTGYGLYDEQRIGSYIFYTEKATGKLAQIQNLQGDIIPENDPRYIEALKQAGYEFVDDPGASKAGFGIGGVLIALAVGGTLFYMANKSEKKKGN